ncbi:MAG: MarR family transcriptional regulator [Pseudomonadota bacterium]
MDKHLATAILLETLVRSAYADRRSGSVQPLQWSILRYLRQTAPDPRSLQAIARYVGVTAAPASRAVDTLNKRGFLTKKRNPDNARSVSIAITSQGLELLENDPLFAIGEQIRQLPAEERSAFIRTLRHLVLHKDESK